MKKLILFILLLLFIPFTLAFNTTLPDGIEYSPLDTITVAIETTTNPEKGDPYNVTWYNGTDIVYNDTGLLSGIVGGQVFEVYTTSATDYWITSYVNVTSNLVTQQLYFNVTGNASNSLYISDATFSPIARLGSPFAVDFQVKDENNKNIDNAKCEIFGTDANGEPLQQCTVFSSLSTTIDGFGICSDILNSLIFEENEQYLVKIRCTCGIGDNSCFDEDGNTIEKHKGSATYVFTVTPWLTVNTITDNDMYEVDDSIYVCANVTNNGTERVPIDIVYNWRCQNGAGDLSTDRILLGNKKEERGISANTTQNQCNSFLIADDLAIEQGAINCYSATSVTVLDKNKNPIYTYDTTSGLFTINVTEINPFVRWKELNSNTFTATVNIDDYDVDFKDIDVRLNDRLTDQGTPGSRLRSYTVTYSNGSTIPYDTEIQVVDTAITDNLINTLNIEKFSELTVTILNVNTSLDEEFKVTVIVDKVGANDMTAIMIGTIILAIFFIGMGIINNSSLRLGVYLRYGSMVIGYLQLLIIAGLSYAYSIGYEVSGLMRVNLWVVGLIGFGLFMLTLYLKSVELLRQDNYANKENEEW